MALIKYNGETLAEIKAGQSITLHTDGHELEGDLVIEGFNGGSSSNCDGCIIEVDTLPTENIDQKALYAVVSAFRDLIIVNSGSAISFIDVAKANGYTYSFNTIPTKTTENIKVTDISIPAYHWYYIVDENDIFIYGDFEGTGTNAWMKYGGMDGGTFNGVIFDVSEATANGYYAVGGSYGYYKHIGKMLVDVFANGEWHSSENKLCYAETRPTENIVSGAVYYIEDENVLALYTGSSWYSIYTVDGVVADRSEVTSETGTYVLVQEWKHFVAPSGTLTIIDNGTFDVTKVAIVNANFARVCGIWRFNETVEKTGKGYISITQNVNFTTAIEGKVYQCTGMWVDASNFSDPTHLEYQGDGVPSVYRGGGDTWLYDSARTVNFGTEPQSVHPDYKSWLINNATRIDGDDFIKASSEAEMDAVLGIAEIGSVVKYTGESTDTYESGALYIVEAVTE